jgi:DNA repair photolyase
MYDWVTHTWNTVKGECPHGCSYCYMHRWGKQKPVRFDEKELKTDLGTGNFIFVGSSCDMFADEIPGDWIAKTLKYCRIYNNSYLFQSKNPNAILIFKRDLPEKSTVCTTIETNRWYPEIFKESPYQINRAMAMNGLSKSGIKTYVTIEPIIDFDLMPLIGMIENCHPEQVNIGADTGNNHLPEPPKEKILELIAELEKFTVVKQKSNLKRLLK